MRAIAPLLAFEGTAGSSIWASAREAVEAFHARPEKHDYDLAYLVFNERVLRIHKGTTPEMLVEDYDARLLK